MKKLTLERTFPATIDRVWDSFVSPLLLQSWWAPPGMHCRYPTVDLRPGGMFHYCFQGDDEHCFWGRAVYQSIEEPNYLSLLDAFADEHGNAVAPSYYGIPGDEVLENLVEFEFTTEGPNTHMLVMMDNPYDEAMTEELIQGWHGMFDKLVALLQSAPVVS
ncbi:MAG: SRPBCC domain-containing protein [Lewinella sp.]|nr:SRPBCC domain-containing protein [Lewinella sp.]